MIAGRIPEATRVLGAPRDWDEAVHGHCGGLPIRDIPDGTGLNYMVSAWQPTPEEMALIAAGGPVLLWIVGVVHPPVSLSVGAAPE